MMDMALFQNSYQNKKPEGGLKKKEDVSVELKEDATHAERARKKKPAYVQKEEKDAGNVNPQPSAFYR